MLIKCIECNHDISEFAESCPNCGCPMDVIKKVVLENARPKVCPVCKTKLKKSEDVCSVCKFPELHREFADKNEEKIWIEAVVTPYRKEWEENRLYLNGFDIEGTVLKKYRGNSKKVTIPDCVTVIGDGAFSYRKQLTTVSIPNTVTKIGVGAFMFCDALLSITIPGSVEYIGQGAFSLCKSLTSIMVDLDNKSYSSINGVLYSKDKTVLIRCPQKKVIQTFDIPEGVTHIYDYAFELCFGMKTIQIPNSVISIGSCAFSHCGIDSITIPNSVENIGTKALDLGGFKSKIYIPQNLTISPDVINEKTEIIRY